MLLKQKVNSFHVRLSSSETRDEQTDENADTIKAASVWRRLLVRRPRPMPYALTARANNIDNNNNNNDDDKATPSYLPKPAGRVLPQAAPTLSFLRMTSSNLRTATGWKSMSPSMERM